MRVSGWRRVNGCQKTVNDEIGDLSAQPLTSRLIESEMLPREDAAQRSLLGGTRKARERADNAWRILRRDVELEPVSFHDRRQDIRRGRTDHCVGSRIWGI